MQHMLLVRQALLDMLPHMNSVLQLMLLKLFKQLPMKLMQKRWVKSSANGNMANFPLTFEI